MQFSTMAVSYRRNRDYGKKSEWNYELNRDLYECYKKAKADPKIGYMNRLKNTGMIYIQSCNIFQAKIYVIKQVELKKVKSSWIPNITTRIH